MKRNLMILIMALLPLSIFSQPIQISPLEVNSGADDFAPMITRNGKTMMITSDKKRNAQKVFTVERTEDGWELIGTLNGDVNEAAESGSVTLTPDGQYLIFAAKEHDVEGEGRTDLYSARKVNGRWTDIQNLGPAVNSSSWDSQPSLSSDGNTLFFASDRPDGFGGTDIFIAKRSREGWSKAVNAGANINTSADELTPYVAYDNETMSFASNRPGGKGLFDIYFVKYNDGNFATPQAAPEPINSSADEIYYYIHSNTNVAYFASNRDGGTGGLDIYSAIPNPYLSKAVVYVDGIVRDAVTREFISADIVLTDLATKQKVAMLRSDDESGEYYAVLQAGKKYSITAKAKDYVFYSEKFTVDKDEKGKTINKDIDLYPLKGGKTKLLVFFDFDKSILQEDSYPELDRIVEFLNDNPDVRIRLEGHTDNVGGEAYNKKLSEDRTLSVKNYLVKEGIEKDRIETKGFGLSNPIAPNDSEENKAINRRVEMIILD